MKKILSLLFIIHCSCAFAQLAVKLSYIRPTGTMGATLKPTVGGELIYKPSKGDDKKSRSGFNLRIGLGFAKFTPRLDTFPTYGVLVSQATTVTPGYTVIHKYNITTLSMGVDYTIGLSEKFYIYPGMDVGALFSSLQYESVTPLISDAGYSGGYAFLSTRLRFGAEYFVKDNLSLFTEATAQYEFFSGNRRPGLQRLRSWNTYYFLTQKT